jgi:hypothetical protein
VISLVLLTLVVAQGAGPAAAPSAPVASPAKPAGVPAAAPVALGAPSAKAAGAPAAAPAKSAGAPVASALPLFPAGTHELLANGPKGFLGDAKVGQWATYRLDGGSPGREFFWRLAVVGEKRDAKGRPAQWVEMEFGAHPAMAAPLAQWKVLVAKGKGFDQDGVSEMYVGIGTGRVQQVASESLEHSFGAEEAPRPKPKGPKPELPAEMRVRRTQPTQLMTLGGTVTAVATEVMYRDTVIKRIWVSDQIPLLHLAKIEIPAIRHSMEVRDFGVDARPRIVLPGPDVPMLSLEPGEELPSFEDVSQQYGVTP